VRLRQCTCGAKVLWAPTLDGGRMPLEPEELDLQAVGLVMRNPKTGKCKVLAAEDIAKVEGWRRQGGTVHRSHWATCPHAARHRVHPAQESLAL
jgi:hypothetical protein